MGVYVAMVELINETVGRVSKYLDDSSNTFILSMSGNGAKGVMLQALPMTGSVGTSIP